MLCIEGYIRRKLQLVDMLCYVMLGASAPPFINKAVPPVAGLLLLPVWSIYRYDTGIWGFIDSFRVVLVYGMRKWYTNFFDSAS